MLFKRTNWPETFRDLIEAVESLSGNVDPRIAALTRNLRTDHRVSDWCAEVFLDVFQEASKGKRDLVRSLRYYRRDLAAKHPEDCFLHANNESNFVPDPGGFLAHVWNMSYQLADMEPRELKALETQKVRQNGYSMPSDIGGQDEASDVLEQLFSIDKDGVMEAMLAVRNRRALEEPYHPMWAGEPAAFFEEAKEGDSASWMSALGMELNPANQKYIAVFCYRLPDGVRLVRPTQLEAGDDPMHYPSPETDDARFNGFAMQLRPDKETDSRKPLGEYIHRLIPLELRHWTVGGKRWSGKAQGFAVDLNHCRDIHAKRLKG